MIVILLKPLGDQMVGILWIKHAKTLSNTESCIHQAIIQRLQALILRKEKF